MAGGKGSDFLLKIWDGVSAYTTVGGTTTDSFTINNETVETTTKGASKWRELISQAGIQSMSVSGDGIFKDGASEDLLRVAGQTAAVTDFEIYSSNGDKWQGSFVVSSYERGGEHNGAETFSYSLESAGDITFTAA